MVEEKLITLRFTGSVYPETIRARELSGVIAAIEDVLADDISQEPPDTPGPEVQLSLVGIDRAGSTNLRFRSGSYTGTLFIISVISAAVESGGLENLPTRTVSGLQEISKFTRRHKCNAELRDATGSEPRMVITPETEIKQRDLGRVRGETTLLGKVIWVGGKNDSKLHLMRPDDSVLVCSTSENVAKLLGHYLYEWVTVSGTAEWDARNYSVISFEVSSLSEYQDQTPQESFDQLRALVAGRLDGIDPAKFTSDARD